MEHYVRNTSRISRWFAKRNEKNRATKKKSAKHYIDDSRNPIFYFEKIRDFLFRYQRDIL